MELVTLGGGEGGECSDFFSQAAMLQYIAFLTCLQFAICNSICNTILKPKQIISLEYLHLTRDVVCDLPTGYGKSLIFHVLPGLLFTKQKLDIDLSLRNLDVSAITAVIIVVSPLSALISNQISHLGLSGIRHQFLGLTFQNKKANLIPLSVIFDFAMRTNYMQVIITLYSPIQSLLSHASMDGICCKVRHTRGM